MNTCPAIKLECLEPALKRVVAPLCYLPPGCPILYAYTIGMLSSQLNKHTGRARSAYNHFGRPCHSNFSSFEMRMRGTAVTMLTGQRQSGLQCIRCGSKCPPLRPNVSLAIERLRTFAFVGLTEEWALSICLLHVIHGPTFGTERCDPAEFFNSREVRFHITVLRGQPDG